MLPAMPRHARELFLAEPRIGVLGVTDSRSSARGPLLVPVWFSYEPGGHVVFQTGRQTIKAQLVRVAQRFSICVQAEVPPYRYVSVEGPVTSVDDPVDPVDRDALARRYLGSDEAHAYLAATSDQLRDDILFRMRPQHWRTADFARFAADFATAGDEPSGEGSTGATPSRPARTSSPR